MYICNKCGSYSEEFPTEYDCHEEVDKRPYLSPATQSNIESMHRDLISDDPIHFQEWLATEWLP